MKIALLHYAVPPVVGGVENVISQHARLMVAHGHHVRLIAGRGEKTEEQIEYFPLPLADSRHPEVLAIKPTLDSGRIPPGFYSLVRDIETGLEEDLRGIDVLVAHNVCSLNKNLALTAAIDELSRRPTFPPLVLWHHDLAWTTPRYQSELHAGFPWDLLRTDWPQAIQVVVSEFRRKELAELLAVPPHRIQVIPNGVDLAAFLKLAPLTKTLVQAADLLASSPLLLMPVRITSRKNIEFAIRVMAALRKTNPLAKLVVSGPLGPHNPANQEYFKRLTDLRARLDLQEAVVFMAEIYSEYLPDEVIADLYRLADALFFPSQEEGFGIPVLEAGLAGIPVFCSDIPPLRDLAGDLAETFAPDSDPAAVAWRISERLHASHEYSLRRRVIQKYTWQKIYLDHIQPLLARIE